MLLYHCYCLEENEEGGKKGEKKRVVPLSYFRGPLLLLHHRRLLAVLWHTHQRWTLERQATLRIRQGTQTQWPSAVLHQNLTT